MSKRPITIPISTAKELIDFARAINTLHNEQQRDLVVTLAGDIDLISVEWTPTGNEDIPFYGTFDGGGHTISGLYIDKTEGVCCGLFGVYAAPEAPLKTSPSPASPRMPTPPWAASGASAIYQLPAVELTNGRIYTLEKEPGTALCFCPSDYDVENLEKSADVVRHIQPLNQNECNSVVKWAVYEEGMDAQEIACSVNFRWRASS